MFCRKREHYILFLYEINKKITNCNMLNKNTMWLKNLELKTEDELTFRKTGKFLAGHVYLGRPLLRKIGPIRQILGPIKWNIFRTKKKCQLSPALKTRRVGFNFSK